VESEANRKYIININSEVRLQVSYSHVIKVFKRALLLVLFLEVIWSCLSFKKSSCNKKDIFKIMQQFGNETRYF